MAIPFLSDISGKSANFAGSVEAQDNLTLTKSSGNNQIYINSSGGGAPVIYFEDPNRKWGQFVSNGHLYFKDETANITSLKIDGATATAAFAGNVGAGGVSGGPKFPLDVNGVSMLRTEADMWQSEQKFMRVGRYGRGTGTADRQHYLTAKVDTTAANNFISFNIDNGSTSDGSSHATNVLKLSGDGNATFAGDVNVAGNIILTGASNEIIKSNGSIRLNIDSDANQTDRIFIVSTGNNSELFRVDESGNGTFAGTIDSGAITSTGNIITGGFFQTASSSIIKKYVSSWNSGVQTHDVIYNGWYSNTGDYTYLKAAGNSTGGHGIILAADNGTYLGTTDIETGGVTDSATAPLSNTWAYFRNATAYIKGDTTFAGTITCGNITTQSRITFDYGGDHYIETGTNTLSFKSSGGTIQSTFNFSDLSTTFAGDILVSDTDFKIGANTSDGSDNAQVKIMSGGDATDTRGASIHLAGNEHGNAGLLQLRAGDGTTGGIRLYEGGSERMRITAGKVSIGIGTPQEKLHVYNAGTARIEIEGTTGPAAFKATNSQGSFGWYVPSSANKFNLWNFNTSADLIEVGASGDTTFLGSVSIQSDNDNRFLVRSNDYTISRIISRGSSGADLDKGLFSLMSSDGTNNNVEKVRIDSASASWFNGGDVAIGSNSAGGKLDITQSSSTTPVLRLTDDGVANYDFIFPDTSTIKLETNTSSTKTFKLLNAGSGDFDFEASNATFAGAVTVEGGTLELGKADTSSGHINAKELMTFNIDTDNDDTNRYFAWYKDSSSGSGTELLKILETGNATFAGTVTATHFYGDGSNLTGLTVSNADTVDNLHAASFLRSDAADTGTGQITLADNNAADSPLILGSSNQTTYTLQQWRTSSHGENTAYIVAYGGGHGSQAGNFAIKNTLSGKNIFFEVNNAVPLKLESGTSTFTGDIVTSGNIYLNNNKTIFGKNTSGSNYGLLTITSGNVVKLGAYAYTSAATEIGLGDNGKFLIGTAEALSIDNSKNATFTGNVIIANTSGSQTSPTTHLLFDNNNIDDSGGYNIDFKSSSNDTANRYMSRIQALRTTSAKSSLGFFTESGSALTRALLLDDSQNATFAGQISVTAGGFNTAANVNSTGDKGIAIHSGARLGFDQSGTRSWSIKADGGNLNVFSGDGNGGLNVALTDGVITNTIKTRSGDLDIYTVLTSRDMRFRSGNNTVQLRVKGDNSGIQIHDIASLRAASVTSATTTTTVSSIPIGTYTAAFFDYSIKNSTNVRAGTVVATHDGTNVEFNETSTVDLGDTSDVTLSVDISSGDMRLKATTTSSTWTIKALIRGI